MKICDKNTNGKITINVKEKLKRH